jgi:ATP-dependent Lon protease
VDALTAKLLELVSDRLQRGFQFPVHVLKQFGELIDPETKDLGIASLQDLVKYMVSINNPDHLADLVSCTLLPNPEERQTILEKVNLEDRLKSLIHFLIAENARSWKEDHK